MFNISCAGDEATLFDCVYNEVVSFGSNCDSYEDAGVICQGCLSSSYANNIK